MLKNTHHQKQRERQKEKGERPTQTSGEKGNTDLTHSHTTETLALSAYWSLFFQMKTVSSLSPLLCEQEQRQRSKSQGRSLFNHPVPRGALRWFSPGCLQAAPYKNAFHSPGKSWCLQLMITSIYDTCTAGLLDNAPGLTGTKTIAVILLGEDKAEKNESIRCKTEEMHVPFVTLLSFPNWPVHYGYLPLL